MGSAKMQVLYLVGIPQSVLDSGQIGTAWAGSSRDIDVVFQDWWRHALTILKNIEDITRVRMS
ncbi:hypothetical protein E2562_026360 [Oryza meyeriana var. granulata]|uniref:Uncharacterized protein n=1 Tax=Oryza meyeriana var. granulata TaxID=110450 RepID=A0A6G1EZ95_9ORYZ|nr:hypothetical protein E2562_026360 [Oryza meyeriana var. granulata]